MLKLDFSKRHVLDARPKILVVLGIRAAIMRVGYEHLLVKPTRNKGCKCESSWKPVLQKVCSRLP